MAKRRCTMTAEEVLERWDDLGKDLEMGSSDEMSDDDQLQWSEEFDDLDEPDDPTRSWRVAMTSSATWEK